MSGPSCRAAILLFLSVVVFLPAPLTSQSRKRDDAAPLLTLNEAIQMALSGNRSVKIASLEVEKSREQVSITKTKRLPAWNSYLFGSQLLSEVGFTFPEGAFGNFQGIGPVPPSNTTVITPRRPTAYVVNQVTQPLSQLYKINLAVRAQELAVELTHEKFRAERQSVVDSVKQAYYAVLQSASALEATEATVKQYQELDRVLLQRVSQEAALKSGSLEVKAKLAQEQYKLVQLRNALQSRKEYLNDLLGRDIRTQFRTEEVAALSPLEINLTAAQETALSHRPEIKQDEMTLRQADYDRRLAKADYIPDVALAFHYFSNFNFDVLPQNVVAIIANLTISRI
jgi:outer membrane protein